MYRVVDSLVAAKETGYVRYKTYFHRLITYFMHIGAPPNVRDLGADGFLVDGSSAHGEGFMAFVDRILVCIECGAEFVFSAGEQLFFHEKQFTNDPKRCKQCKAKSNSGRWLKKPEMQTTCAECGAETTVPFKPTQGRPVLCRSCFANAKSPRVA
jgi:CxxC-x17-CxxC domain-containing protein